MNSTDIPRLVALRRWLVPALLLLFASQGLFSMRQKSVTTDEIMYLTAGYYHLRTGEFGYNRTNPPLTKMLTALPLLVLSPDLPAIESDPATWSEIEQWRYSRKFLYENRINADRILFATRLPVLALALILGLYVQRWARRLYGERAALLSLFLFAFSPNLLAHARLATQDLALATFGFAAAYHLWRYIEQPTWRPLLLSATYFAVAAATKTTAILLVLPLLLALTLPFLSASRDSSPGISAGPLDRIRRPLPRRLAKIVLTYGVFAICSLSVLNLSYGFEGSFVSAGHYEKARTLEHRLSTVAPPLAPVFRAGLHLPVPIPEPMIRLIEFQSTRISEGNNVFFHGRLSREGWWYVIPVAVLIKTPLPLLLLASLSMGAIVWRRRPLMGEWFLIGTTFFMLALFAYFKSVSIGLRYVLLIYPCLHVLAGRWLQDGRVLRRGARVALTLALSWYLVGAVRTYPHYLPYFNETVGGSRNGYRFLADSFVDWGQDLPALKIYMERNGIERIRLAYFGSADATHHGIEYDYLPSVGLAPNGPGQKWWYEPDALPGERFDPAGGPIAISATMYNGVFLTGFYEPLHELEPVAQVGHSILIFDPERR
ncbi:MAG: glycosyltransferase family 39 protein [Acidobacteriota bacterium]|nr:glycosyltransferase family 39 protein [Acidobacteriota bacterium]MDH3785904.1 glycosyltransferase family 39 protein [Acidobacteriota bacterium]